MPYVFFASPGEWQAWPKSAACWSPAMPAIGTSMPEMFVWPQIPDDGDDARQHRARNVEERQQLVVPAAGADVEEQRAARVRRIGHVRRAAGQVPDEPGVDGAEGELALRRARARARNVVEQPLELGAREIGVEHEARLARDHRRMARGAQRVAQRRRAPVLPDDGRGDGRARRAVPQHGGLALVGDADGGEVARADAGLGERLVHDARLRRPDLAGVVLDPAGLREDLPELLLRDRADRARMIEDEGAGAGGALIEREDE